MNWLNTYWLKILSQISFLIISFASLSIAQQQKQPPIIFFEKNVIFSDSSYICYLSYRIPFSNLFFVKERDEFVGGVNLNFELKNPKGIVDRQNIKKTVKVENYEKSKSEQEFVEGVVNFNIKDSINIIQPYLSILNSNNTIKMDSISLYLKRYYKGNISYPIVTEPAEENCLNHSLFQLVNYQNSIPFTSENYVLLISVIDTTLTNIEIKIEQEGKVAYEANNVELHKNNLMISECNNKIVLVENHNLKEITYLILKDFSYKLNEGVLKIVISSDKINKVEFYLNVVWNDKPKSLMNPELAIELLEIIFDKETVAKLLDSDKKDYPQKITEFWNSKLPDRKTAFNSLMSEFYRRADYAIENYSTIDKPNGAKSDRGRVYIKLGKPDNVMRDYSDNKVTEVWKYNNLSMEFVFTDRSGLGNFTLE